MKKLVSALPYSHGQSFYFRLLITAAIFLGIIGLPKNSFSQNTGIGTTNPIEKLHVNGNIKSDTLKPNAIKLASNAGAGKLLTSDALGNASWQNANSAVPGNIGYGVWGDCATAVNLSAYQPLSDSSARFDSYGLAVALSGDFAIVGSAQDDGPVGDFQGSVSFYRFNGVEWELMQKIFDATGAPADFLGVSVAISGNYAIAGAWSDDGPGGSNQGSACIFQYNGTNWVLTQKLTDVTGAANDYFGYSVSISGNYAIVGAVYDEGPTGQLDMGSVSIYQYNGTNWVLMQKIYDATGAANDFFGSSVSISGNYAIVGAYNDAGTVGAGQGSASIYLFNGISWVLMQKLTELAAATNDNFGRGVAISGNYAIVGVSGDDQAVADQGSACFFQYNGATWTQIEKVFDAGGAANDYFGFRVAMSGNYAIVGAWGDNVQQGSATIYQRLGSGWQKLQFVTDPAATPYNYFGQAVGIDGKRFLIGAPGFANDRGKAIFGKIN